MSSRKVKRELDYTAVWASNVLTVTTTLNHNLVTGDAVRIKSTNSPQDLQASATVTSATVFTVQCSSDYALFLTGTVSIDSFRAGATGRYVFIPQNSTGAGQIIQSFVTGTGTTTATLEGSLDNLHWVPALGTLSNTATDGSSTVVAMTNKWTYLAVNISAIGASTKMEIMYTI
jgi:hypothetical protein